ncbi:MAG: T9SS type A sorting domain-containing protein [Bacteroidota bacterium]|nr:T9SS type A sorting domain-containing protein [Bacteroidota bacterium]
MKKIYLSLLSLVCGLTVNAQTLTDANHSPAAGDMNTTWQCDSLTVTPGASGAGATWNYGTIVTHSSVVNNYTAAVNTNTSYPIPGIAFASSINNISYYKSSPTDLKYWGGNIFVGGLSATLIYTNAAVTASYPMNLNTTASSVTGGSISIPSLSQNGTFTGNSNTLADGTGTLILPSGTYNNGIRVVTTQTINFTAPLGSGTVTQVNYDYYEAGVKNSLFTISTSTFQIGPPFSSTSTQTIVTRSNPSTVGLKENKQNVIDMVVFPNPASTTLNFATESKEAKQVLIYDVTGKLVDTQTITDGKLKLNVSAYNNGLYTYSVIGNNNQTLRTGKVTVSH